MWEAVRGLGMADVGALSVGGATPAVIDFFRNHDLSFRIRRLRMLERQIEEISNAEECPRDAVEQVRDAVYQSLSRYLDRQMPDFYDAGMIDAARAAETEPLVALAKLAQARDLKTIDDEGDQMLAGALAKLPKPERRSILLAYLGFPFYDIATLPLLSSNDQDEFNPIKVDRIAPDDATSIREGGADATLKGIQLNSFGAFFSRAYRENDYLWGRLHGADRLIDIVVSALPKRKTLPPGEIATLKKKLFRSILAEERSRLEHIPELLATLDREIG
jgi:patatin-related protein